MSSARTLPRAGVGMLIALGVSLVASQVADAASRSSGSSTDPPNVVEHVDARSSR